MAAISKHYGDVLLWLDKVIESCVTEAQVASAVKLITNFEKTYGENSGLYMKATWKNWAIFDRAMNEALMKDIENGLVV